MALSYGIISSPWCIKPFFGFVSDKFGIFDWGRRRPYISFTGLVASVVYVYMRIFIHDRLQFVVALTLVSALICFADVCADSIMVEMCKRETVKGKLQSNCWMARAFGGLLGSLFGGIAYNGLGAVATFHICASATLLMAVLVWRLPISVVVHFHDTFLRNLFRNISEQKYLAIVFLCINMTPDCSAFYAYFLRRELLYTAIDFSWITVASSLSLLLSTFTFNRLLLEKSPSMVVMVGIFGAAIFKSTQFLVVSKTLPYFWIVLGDSVAESFFRQLVMMPLIVQAANVCNVGVEGTLYALMMSISNLSGVIGEWLGAWIGAWLDVTETHFDNLMWMLLIDIIGNLVVPFLVIIYVGNVGKR
tara:strand:- start:777 stop:1859 length:1083 start_codon:yes stop_codon:yes gene_type:complete